MVPNYYLLLVLLPVSTNEHAVTALDHNLMLLDILCIAISDIIVVSSPLYVSKSLALLCTVKWEGLLLVLLAQ